MIAGNCQEDKWKAKDGFAKICSSNDVVSVQVFLLVIGQFGNPKLITKLWERRKGRKHSAIVLEIGSPRNGDPGTGERSHFSVSVGEKKTSSNGGDMELGRILGRFCRHKRSGIKFRREMGGDGGVVEKVGKNATRGRRSAKGRGG